MNPENNGLDISREEFLRAAGAFGFMAALGGVATACGTDVGEQAQQQADTQGANKAQAEHTMVLSLDGIKGRWPDQPVYQNTMWCIGGWELKENIERHSDGRIFVEIHPGGELGGQTAVLEKVQQGVVDAATCSTQNAAAIAPVWNMTDVPYSIGPVSNYWKIIYSKEVNDALRETSRNEFNLIPLAGFPQLRWLEMRKGLDEIRLPEDTSGLKIRVTGSKLEQAAMDILPANPTPVEWTEVFTALTERAVDGVHVGPASVADAGLVEALGQVVDTKWMYNNDTLWVGTSFFDELPDDLQEAVMEAAFDTQVWIHDRFEELFTKQVGMRKDSPPNSIYQQPDDLTFVYLNEEERGVWEETLGYENNKAVYDPMIERYGRNAYETVVNVANAAGTAEQKRWWT